MEDIKTLQKIINGSKEYSFSGTVLTIKSYYTGESIKLDLSLIDEDMLEEIIVRDDGDFEDEYEDDEFDDDDFDVDDEDN